MGQVSTVPHEITSYADEDTQVPFCKELFASSEEKVERKGIRRHYEGHRPERRRKRLCYDSEGDESICSIASDNSPPNSTKHQRTHSIKKPKSEPVPNQLITSPQRDSVSEQSLDTEIIEVAGKKIHDEKEEYEVVTIYDKVVMRVASSDMNFLVDPINRFNPKITEICSQKLLISKADYCNPVNIKGYEESIKKPFRKGMLCVDGLINRSNDSQITPVIRELENMDDSEESHRGAVSKPCTVLQINDPVSSSHEIKALSPDEDMMESRIQRRGLQAISDSSTLFPNSCMKKEPNQSTTKKTVRFKFSETQDNMGGELIPKKSFWQEKFPPVLKTTTPASILTAAPVVIEIQNPISEQGAMMEEIMEEVVCRNTVERVIQKQLINNRKIIPSIQSNRRQFDPKVNGTKVISLPWDSNFYPTQGKINCVEMITAIFQNHPGTPNDTVEVVEYTLSDLGIPRKNKFNIQNSPESEAKSGAILTRYAKRDFIERRQIEIRNKSNQPDSESTQMENVVTHSPKIIKANGVARSYGKNTNGGSISKPGRAGDADTKIKQRFRKVNEEPVDVNMLGNGSQRNRIRPESEYMVRSLPGGSRPTCSNERSKVSQRSRPTDGDGTLNTSSSNKPPSRKPHTCMPRKTIEINDESSARSARTFLTVRPRTTLGPKTTSTNRDHLRSIALGSVESVQPRSEKMYGHPLRNKTLKAFLEERKSRIQICPAEENISDKK